MNIQSIYNCKSKCSLIKLLLQFYIGTMWSNNLYEAFLISPINTPSIFSSSFILNIMYPHSFSAEIKFRICCILSTQLETLGLQRISPLLSYWNYIISKSMHLDTKSWMCLVNLSLRFLKGIGLMLNVDLALLIVWETFSYVTLFELISPSCFIFPQMHASRKNVGDKDCWSFS